MKKEIFRIYLNICLELFIVFGGVFLALAFQNMEEISKTHLIFGLFGVIIGVLMRLSIIDIYE